jgi:hypothetical protein
MVPHLLTRHKVSISRMCRPRATGTVMFSNDIRVRWLPSPGLNSAITVRALRRIKQEVGRSGGWA